MRHGIPLLNPLENLSAIRNVEPTAKMMQYIYPTNSVFIRYDELLLTLLNDLVCGIGFGCPPVIIYALVDFQSMDKWLSYLIVI